MKLPEKFLHFVWRYKSFNQLDLRTTEGAIIRIVEFGQYNVNAGPDFEYAKLYIDDVLWVGNIEMHMNDTDWNLHHHYNDSRYNNTILHVVWRQSDCSVSISRKDGTNIPTLCICDYVNQSTINNYYNLSENINWIPCERHLNQVNSMTIVNWLDRVLVERLDDKSSYYQKYLEELRGDWEKLLLIAIGRSFGMKVNSFAFENFTSQIDLALIRKYQGNLSKIESICFGLAGFLQEECGDDCYLRLRDEFTYLKKIHNLKEIQSLDWKFLRMRPTNFPTVRLAQFAGLINSSTQWFTFLLEIADLEDFKHLFKNLKFNVYWRNHYRFNHEIKDHDFRISDAFVNHLCINAFIPILFLFGRYTKNEIYLDKAISWLQNLPAESNAIIRDFGQIGIQCVHAGDSQAILQLKGIYCDQKQCLNCAIGAEILKTNF